MTINNIHGVGGQGEVPPRKENVRGNRPVAEGKGLVLSPDDVEISKEARTLNKTAFITKGEIVESIKNIPEVREAKVREAKAKLLNGDLDQPEVIEELASKLSSVLRR